MSDFGADIGDFDSTAYENAFEELPPGVYTVKITKSEKMLSKKGNEYLALNMEVMQPQEFAKRIYFANLNLWHPDEKVQGYARTDLASIGRAIGVFRFQNTQQLHGIPFKIHLVPSKDGLNIRVKKYESLSGNVAPPAATAPAARKQPPTSSAQMRSDPDDDTPF